MASKQQIIHIITEIAVLASITAYFLYRNKVLNEKMKSLEFKIFQQEEIIKKHDTILQTLLSSSNTYKDNKQPIIHKQNNNISNFFNDKSAGGENDETDTSDDDDDDGVLDDKNDAEKSHNTHLQNSVIKFTDTFKQNPKIEPPHVGKVVISIGELPIPDFSFDSILQPIPSRQDDELISSKVEEIFDKNITQNQEIDDIDDTSSSDNNSGKKKKKKKNKNKKNKNLTEDEILDLEILNEIQELA